MNTVELRKGNTVLVAPPNMEVLIPSLEATVQGITAFGEVLCNGTSHTEGFKIPYKFVAGIPLTDKWLKKLGFEYVKEHESWGNGKIGVFFIEGEVSYNIARMKNVHQLQNLYFALTGEELEVK